jgi:integrase
MTGDTKGKFRLYQREKGGPWYVGTVRLSTGTTDRRQAEAIRSEIMHEIREGKFFQRQTARKHTFEDLREKFLSQHAPTVEPGTRKFYEERMAYLAEFFKGMRLSDIDGDQVSKYVSWRRRQAENKESKCSPTTRNRELGVLSKMFSLAMVWGMAQSNPCKLVAMEKEDNDIGRPLSESEESALIAVSSENLRDIVTLLIYTGMRRGQALMLEWSDVDMDGGIIRTTNEKTNQPYLLPICPTVHEMLSRRRQSRDKGIVFSPGDGKPYDGQNLLHSFQRACKNAGLPKLRIHDLRHTTGARLESLGMDVHYIAAILNHSQLSTTRRYAKHNTESLKKGLDLMSAKRLANPNLKKTDLHTTCTQALGDNPAVADSVAVTDRDMFDL